MAYEIQWTPDAKVDLRALSRAAQALVVEATPRFLADQPGQTSRRRKQLTPNPLDATWELRLDEVEVRVYYDILEERGAVRILRVGRKVRNRVFLRGIETEMREQQ